MTPRPQLLLRFADEAQRERLDALAATWGCTPQAALRRLLDEATTATTADVVTVLRAVLAQGERAPRVDPAQRLADVAADPALYGPGGRRAR